MNIIGWITHTIKVCQVNTAQYRGDWGGIMDLFIGVLETIQPYIPQNPTQHPDRFILLLLKAYWFLSIIFAPNNSNQPAYWWYSLLFILNLLSPCFGFVLSKVEVLFLAWAMEWREGSWQRQRLVWKGRWSSALFLEWPLIQFHSHWRNGVD